MNKIYLRTVLDEDCNDVFSWRNDEKTRNANFCSGIISYEDHKIWFNDSLKNPNRFIYIAEDGEKNKIGIVRLDKLNNHVAEFDINVVPKMRGNGYARQMIELSCEIFLEENNVDIFIARIKSSNLASIKSFRNAGFFELFNCVDVKHGEIVAFVKMAMNCKKFMRKSREINL